MKPPILAAAFGIAAFASTSLHAGEPLGTSSWSNPSDDDLTGFYLKGQFLYQEADYSLRSLQLGLPNAAALSPELLATLSALGPKIVTSVEDTSRATSAFLEWRPLDAIGFNARFGTIEGESEISLVAPFESATLDYDGYVYGFGPTVYGALKEMNNGLTPFGLLAAEWTRVEFGDDGGSNEIWSLRPKIGLKTDRFAVWTGATWLDNTQKRQGVLNIAPLGGTTFKSESEDVVHWNYTVGISYEFVTDLTIAVEAGFGERQHLGVGLSYHF